MSSQLRDVNRTLQLWALSVPGISGLPIFLLWAFLYRDTAPSWPVWDYVAFAIGMQVMVVFMVYNLSVFAIMGVFKRGNT